MLRRDWWAGNKNSKAVVHSEHMQFVGNEELAARDSSPLDSIEATELSAGGGSQQSS